MWKSVFCVIVCVITDITSFPGPVTNVRKKVPDTKQNPSTRIATRDFSLGPCLVVLNRICPDRDVTFHLYTREHPMIPERVYIGEEISNLSSTAFNPELPTKIIIHGYNSDMHLSVLEEVRKEYLRSRPLNVFAVNWGNLAQGPCYPAAVWNSRFVGKCSAQLVERIRDTGATDIHVVGFSLGAHVTGFMANNLRPYKLPRITGLDPAMPGFITSDNENKLDASDAKFVDVIHTNAFVQGQVQESGHVDFYVNGGTIQPGCWAEERFFACNHHRAPLYFAESINTDQGFWGWPCPSYFVFVFGRCPPVEPQILMGEHVNPTAKGVHLVITDSVSPFAVGKYTGPLVEIYVRNVDPQPAIDPEKYRKEISDFYDMDDWSESLADSAFQLERDEPDCSNFTRQLLDIYSFPEYVNFI